MLNKWNQICLTFSIFLETFKYYQERRKEAIYQKFLCNNLFGMGLDWNSKDIKEKETVRGSQLETDIRIYKDNIEQFVVEVKTPYHKQTTKDIGQLNSYMAILGLKIGIYIGEKLEVYYNPTLGTGSMPICILQANFEENSPEGEMFVKLFNSHDFSKESIQLYYEEWEKRKNEDIKIQENIKFLLSSDGSGFLKDLLSKYYSNSGFNQRCINSILQEINILILPKGSNNPVQGLKTTSLKKEVATSKNQKKQNLPRRPPLKFSMCDVKDGDILNFEPLNLNVIARGQDQVEFNGKIYSMTGFTKEFLPKDRTTNSHSYRGPQFFTFKNKTLVELRNDKEKKNS